MYLYVFFEKFTTQFNDLQGLVIYPNSTQKKEKHSCKKEKGQTETKRTALLCFLFQLFHWPSPLPAFVPRCHRTRQDNLLTREGGIARQLVLLACGPLHRASKCSSACFSASPPPCPSVIAHPWTTTYPPFNLTSTFPLLHNVTTSELDQLKFCIHQLFHETFCL